jgi:hypothetical protein
MNEMHGDFNLSIDGKNITYVLSVGMDIKKNSFYMPSLSFYKDRGMLKTEERIEFWDNDTYIIETLLEKVLEPWNKNNAVENTTAFTEILQVKGVDIKDFPEIQALIEKGIEMGWFKKVNKKLK